MDIKDIATFLYGSDISKLPMKLLKCGSKEEHFVEKIVKDYSKSDEEKRETIKLEIDKRRKETQEQDLDEI